MSRHKEAKESRVIHLFVKARQDDKGGKAFVAHCLELDLIAVDEREWKAVEKLSSLIERQIKFALKHNREDAIEFHAPPKYFAEVPCCEDASLTRFRELFEVKKSNMLCFKIYLAGRLLTSRSSQLAAEHFIDDVVSAYGKGKPE